MLPQVLMFAGSALSAYGKIQQGFQQADNLIADAQLKNEQANEIMRRSIVNQEQIRAQKRGSQARAESAFAASGVNLSGSTLQVLETIATEFDREIANKHIEDSYRADQLRKEASSQLSAVDDTVTAGYMGAFSSVLSGGGEYLKSIGGK